MTSSEIDNDDDNENNDEGNDGDHQHCQQGSSRKGDGKGKENIARFCPKFMFLGSSGLVKGFVGYI